MSRVQGPSWHAAAEAVLLPTGAIAAALLLFGVFVWFGGSSPVEAWVLVLLMTGVSLFGGLGQRWNVAHWAHRGGLAGAALYLAVMERFSPARRFRAESTVPRAPRLGERASLEKWARIRGDELHEVNRSELERIRRILAEQGAAGLSADERAFLDRFSTR